MNRRDFLQRFTQGTAAVAVTGGALAAASRARAALSTPAGTTPEALASNEEHWRSVSALWAPAPDFINLEYGYFHAAALPTLEAELRMARRINSRNSRYKRVDMAADQEAARAALAAAAGAPLEEITITRNATESLDTVILGLDLAPGDEIVYGNTDYGSMIEAIEQKARRSGVVPRMATIPLNPSSDDEVVAAYAAAMTPRTKLVLVTHIINITGQIMPVRKICDLAHARGAEVVLDSAHAFGQVVFRIPDLDCDYMGSSLHKWMCSPLGLGLLYVKKSKIAKVWPLIADTGLPVDDIRKLSQHGTRPESAHVGLVEAIRLHQEIGPANKEARLRFLQQRWRIALQDLPGVVVNSPRDPARYAGVGNVGLRGVDPGALADYLLANHAIFTVGINHTAFQGIRVTPGLPTPVDHVDRFIGAMQAARSHFGLA
jgi:selenocysteine lyase/cysteine desulfurase